MRSKWMEWLRSWNVSFVRKHGFLQKTLSSFLKASSSSYHWCSKSLGPRWQSHVCSLAIDVAQSTCPRGNTEQELSSELDGNRVSRNQSLFTQCFKNKTKDKSKQIFFSSSGDQDFLFGQNFWKKKNDQLQKRPWSIPFIWNRQDVLAAWNWGPEWE